MRRKNESNFNHNYSLPKVVKEILKFNGIKFSQWCRNHNFKDARVRDIFARRVNGSNGIYAEIWTVLNKDFPGWSEEVFSR